MNCGRTTVGLYNIGVLLDDGEVYEIQIHENDPLKLIESAFDEVKEAALRPADIEWIERDYSDIGDEIGFIGDLLQ